MHVLVRLEQSQDILKTRKTDLHWESRPDRPSYHFQTRYDIDL